MTFIVTSPVTGSAQTGFVAPTTTVVTDQAPDINAKQIAVTAVAGMPSVDPSTVSKPFTSTFFKPKQLAQLPPAQAGTGIIKNVPVNTWRLLTRKGALPAANQQPLICRIETRIDVFAGCDTYEPEEIRAMLSHHIGVLNQQSSGLGDTVITGIAG